MEPAIYILALMVAWGVFQLINLVSAAERIARAIETRNTLEVQRSKLEIDTFRLRMEKWKQEVLR